MPVNMTLKHVPSPDKPSTLKTQRPAPPGSNPTQIPLLKGQPRAYTPYGFRNASAAPTGALGFNGEFLSTAFGCYALGNGHRLYNPRLMRFISPDRWSPFFKGGLNPYAYCLNDPVNAKDPRGRSPAGPVIQRTQSMFRPVFMQGAQRMLSTAGHYKTTTKSITASGRTLFNRFAEDLQPEVHHLKRVIKNVSTIFKEVKSVHSLADLDASNRHKYVVTDEKIMIGSSTADRNAPSHASIAELSDSDPGASDKVLAAGHIFFKDGTFYINNHSGHFLPHPDRLEIAQARFGALNIIVVTVVKNVGSRS